jgi:hypothetical protein
MLQFYFAFFPNLRNKCLLLPLFPLFQFIFLNINIIARFITKLRPTQSFACLELTYRKKLKTRISKFIKWKGRCISVLWQPDFRYCFSLGRRWSFEKSRRSSSHFVCTCFIVVGTRLFRYRQLSMEVCIFVKYSKLGGEGKYSTNQL